MLANRTAGWRASRPRSVSHHAVLPTGCLQVDSQRDPRRPPSTARSCWGVSCSARSTACWSMRTGSGALPPVDSADVVLLVFRRPCAHRLLSWACGAQQNTGCELAR